MCYYDQTVYVCGDWKWGHFRKHCQKEYRMGETCGMRLTYNSNRDDNKCTICLQIDKKIRRYNKAKADYDRWIVDPTRQASAAKAVEEMQVLYKETEDLQADRASRYTKIGSNRPRANGANGVNGVNGANGTYGVNGVNGVNGAYHARAG